MLKLLMDEHIDKSLVRGLLRKEPKLDIVRMQDVGLRTKDDERLLAWAARKTVR
jgi:predicted nuclease of predicted toxin-antitoxin system